MFRNGDCIVNWYRSERSSTVASSLDYSQARDIDEHDKKVRKEEAEKANDNNVVTSARALLAGAKHKPVITAGEDLALASQVRVKRTRKKARAKLNKRTRAESSFVNVFIEAHGPKGFSKIIELIEKKKTKFKSHYPEGLHRIKVTESDNHLVATIPVTFLQELENESTVSFVHPAEALQLQIPAAIGGKKPAKKTFRQKKKHQYGKEVYIGIIDVGGFDFSHPDFLDDNGETRFHKIWDQGGQMRSAPYGLGGSELTQQQMNAAIESERKGDLPAHELAPQSQQYRGSHGTHVASIAAGNCGVCRNAKIIGVTVDITKPENQFEARRASFSDSSQIVLAVDYILKVAGKNPVSINISLGTNGGGHDGSSGVTRWLDNALQTQGRSITISAGNSGQDDASDPNDMGWRMGRIHSSGRINSRGLDTELGWVVVGDGVEDMSENELEIWYSAQDRFIVEVLAPGERKPIRVEPKEFVENVQLKDATTVSVYNELYHPANGINAISIYLSPFWKMGDLRGVRAGTWRIRLIGEEIRNGEFHCWIERDDPISIKETQTSSFMNFPSYFAEGSNVDSHSISSLACGHATIAVSNYDGASNKINKTSAQGPTRDSRFKPDIAAPGTNILAANGFAGDDDDKWIEMSGTSMASPYVAGVIGLMLSVNKELTARQCMGILQRTSTPLPGQTYEWCNDAGFGRINADAAIMEAIGFSLRIER